MYFYLWAGRFYLDFQVEKPNKTSQDILGTVRRVRCQKISWEKETGFLKMSSPTREIQERGDS